MQYDAVLARLKEYIVTSVLDGAGAEINETTPLLEWGVMNSLEIVQLVSFVQENFSVAIPANKLIGDNFINLAAITHLILACSEVKAD